MAYDTPIICAKCRHEACTHLSLYIRESELMRLVLQERAEEMNLAPFSAFLDTLWRKVNGLAC